MINEEQQKMIEAYCSNASATSSGVSYYDVELELVDHMTEWVENRMTETDTSFEDSFEMMKDAFPRKECLAIIASKAHSISKGMMRDCFNTFLTYFSWPKITVTFLLVAVIVYIDQNLNISRFPSYAIHLLNIANMFYGLKRHNIVYYNQEEKVLKLISMKKAEQFHFYFFLPSVAYLLLSFFTIAPHMAFAKIVYKIALYIFPLFLLLIIAGRATYISAHEKIRENYPGAFV